MSVKKNVKIMRKFFKKDEWRYSFDEDECVFTGGVQTGSELGNIDFAVKLTDDYATSVCILPVKATEKNLTKFAELICRINYKLIWGAFRLDPTDGELRFQYVMSSEELQDDPMDKAHKLMYLPHQMLSGYGTAFMRVALGTDKPLQELVDAAEKKIEGDDADEDCPDASPSSKSAESDAGTAVQSQQKTGNVDGKVGTSKTMETKEEEEDDDAVPVPVKDYTLDGLNIHGDFSLDRIVTAIRNFRALQEKGCDELPDRPRMNILLWGPPGTGKSEFVNYLGQQLGSKVVVKMASDILSHWVGKTEKAIREAFKEAEEEHAILFLDELDGLMAERSEADANWQVTQVNEILHCMERFNGIMIGATNLKENLDAAVLRRFTYKIEFDYLEAPGKHIFFDRVFKTPLTDDESKRLEAIPNLAPGDFRTVSQQLYYLGTTGNAERLSALEEESGHKKTRRRASIGFGAR